MKLDSIFANYIAYETLNLNLNELTSYCYESKKNCTNNNVRSNHGGWQSNDLNLSDKELQPLIESISKKCIEFTEYFGIMDNLCITHMWAAINKISDFNPPHVHPGSILSGSFYIKVPKNSGNIVFLNSDQKIRFYQQYFKDTNPLIYSKYNIIPEENLICLFPGWLEHYVEPNRSDEDRIVMVFNIGTIK
jgi:uncharacterized protein (TIGR02466 family)